MKFQRLFTQPLTPVSDQIKWKTLPSEILNENGGRIFYMPEVEVPDHWSQGATNILAQKYFRKAGVPNLTVNIPIEKNMPQWLQPSVPAPKFESRGSETSAKQVFHRLAGAWTYWGWNEGIFNLPGNMSGSQNTEDNAHTFYDEIYYMLAMQFAAPNSPQWFNTGLNWAYGITGDKSGQWAVDSNDQPYETQDSYTNPQVHACYIQPISDNLVEEGGIFDLLRKEAIIFKHGSGTGTNFSNLRSKYETLSGGGKSSGMMSFLKIYDSAAGAIQSGGTTRRAAKLICVDLDHPEIEEFIDWKMNEEAKAAALYVGSHVISDCKEEYANLIPDSIYDRINNGIEPEICDLGFEGSAMNTVSGQNANNSVRITDDFLERIGEISNNWPLISRINSRIVKVLSAKDLWLKICRAAWACADPGLQFHDTINKWHTCKSDGTINASNPCSEYMFLDDTACNLASLNLGKFLVNGEFDTKSFIHATRIWTTVLEISVYMASFPSREIARNSYLYRTLGLGYANLGGILMRKGFSYDSDEGRDLAASITALMHGVSYHTSGEMADELGSFARFEANKESMIEVIAKHIVHLRQSVVFSKDIWIKAREIWGDMKIYSSFRNAQVSLLAPTGTIALLMDCDTTGIEPDFSLVKYKHLSGGGMMKIVNECVPEALKTLGYTPAQIMSITQHITDYDTIEGWTVNGQPMPEEHLKVFDCAVPGGSGIRSLPPIAHVKMVAAVQPFLSGAVSKTVNMPNSATIADVDHIYREAHRLGLKAIAIYRDGSKLTQPLNTGQKTKFNKTITTNDLERTAELAEKFGWETKPERSEGRVPDVNLPKEIIRSIRFQCEENQSYCEYPKCNGCGYKYIPKSFEDLLNKTPDTRPEIQRSQRLRLPPRTTGYRQKFIIDGQSIYLRTGEYEDGSLGEIFIDFSREGSLVRALINSIGKLTSIGLQYGVPLSALVNAFVYTKFEPSGIVIGHDRIKLCTSPLDLIFRDLAIHYLGMEEFANIEPPSPERSEGRVPDPTLDLSQEPLGKEFEQVLYGNLNDLYIQEPAPPTPDSTITQDSRISRGAEEEESYEFHNLIITEMKYKPGSGSEPSPLDKFEIEIKQPVLAQVSNSKPLTTIRLKHGDACTACGHYPTLRTGTCITCPNCSANSGCG